MSVDGRGSEEELLDELRRVALFTSGVAELTRHRAEQIVKDLVQRGDVRREQASAAVRDIMDVSRQSRQELVSFVRGEIRAQVANLGLASKRDVERLERRISRLEAQGKRTTAKKPSAKKTTKRTTQRKSPSSG
jgi:polyhydroxyalkanoate synthesis regulator phasin